MNFCLYIYLFVFQTRVVCIDVSLAMCQTIGSYSWPVSTANIEMRKRGIGDADSNG